MNSRSKLLGLSLALACAGHAQAGGFRFTPTEFSGPPAGFTNTVQITFAATDFDSGAEVRYIYDRLRFVADVAPLGPYAFCAVQSGVISVSIMTPDWSALPWTATPVCAVRFHIGNFAHPGSSYPVKLSYGYPACVDTHGNPVACFATAKTEIHVD